MEQRVLFHSERLERIASVVEAITSLMFPFVWPHVYVPLLPIQVLYVRYHPFLHVCEGFQHEWVSHWQSSPI
jgi:hypothetical protein